MRLVLDIETELISDDFRLAKNYKTRLRLAPRPRLACVYNMEKKKYLFFTPVSFVELHKLLKSAREIITYNGERFDFLVLQKALKVSRKNLFKGKSSDLFPIVEKKAGFRVNLNSLAILNLGEEKKIKGKVLGVAPLKILKIGCKSDVRQTRLLWEQHLDKTLEVPRRRPSREDEFDYDPMGQFMPSACPKCRKKGTLLFVEDNQEQMTDGQLAEYLAGTWGSAICTACNHNFSWEA
jgi:hypothetical protein